MRLKKKMLGIILGLGLALGLMPGMGLTALAAKADDQTGNCGDNVNYKLEDTDGDDKYDKLSISGTGAMTDYNVFDKKSPWKDSSENIKTIIIENGVTSIGNHAFRYCEGLTSLSIPGSVTTIGDYAFFYCKGLTSLSIPVGVTSIGEEAFCWCSGLTSVSIPNSVTNIKNGAFTSCKGLTNVTLPDSVTNLGSKVFFSCTGLTDITLPKNLNSISEGLFRYCEKLERIQIPESVTSIGSEAFSSCKALESIAIPKSVTTIGSYAFYNCTGLTDITLPKNLNSISEGLFRYCEKLERIQIPESVTSIGREAFSECKALANITIPASVTSIGQQAFMDCNALANITIPASVTSIEDYAFYNCNSVTDVYCYLDADRASEIDGLTSKIPSGNNITWHVKADQLEAYQQKYSSVNIKGDLYTITFNSNGGTEVASQIVAGGNKATKPAAPTKEGYTFTDWYNGDAKFDFNTAVTSNITLTAKWTISPVTISTQPADVTMTYGDANKSVSVTVANLTGQLSYQWYCSNTAGFTPGDSNKIKGATGQSYAIPSNTSAGTLYVKCVITNTDGSSTATVTSNEATVTINKAAATAATVTANNRTYDGTKKPLVTVTGETIGGEMKYAVTTVNQEPGVEAYTFNNTSIPTGTNAGTYYVWYKVKADENHNDTDANYVEVSIGKRSVTLTSATASKTYDGTALTNTNVTVGGDGFVTGEGATYSVTGSQKVVGSSANAFTYTLNTGTKEANYNITKTEGTLTVTSRDAKYQISPQANSDELKYDGQSHEVTGFETDTFTVEGNTYTVSGLTAAGSGTDAGSYTVSVSGTAVVKDSDGNDVSDEFSVTPQTGTLTINKRRVTMTSATDTKKYDGDALTNDEVTVTGDGFVTGEGATYDVTGTRTVVGVSENTFTFTLKDNTKADNYDITPSFGTLTVTNRNTKYEVTLKANSGTEKYDGKEKTVSGYTIDGNAGEGTGESAVTSFTASNGKTYTVTGMSAKVTGTNAGEYVVNVIGTPIVKDADGNDVTTQFAVSGESGKLTVTKSDSSGEVTAVSGLVYDGKAKALVTAGKTEGGTLMYRLGTDGKWQQDIPEATDAGTYKIYYYIKGDDNHKDDGSEKEPKGSVETTIKKATINLKSVTQKNNKVQISWTKVNEADGYDVYVRYCGSKAKKPVKTIKKNTTTKTSVAKINGKKINQKKNFHVKVYAYKMVNGKKKIIAKTITAHLAGTKSVKYTNPKALKLTKSTYSIKVGKTAKIKAKVTLKNSKKKLLPKSHAAKLRYKSSNTKIATVNKNGTIKGKKKGTCYIYVYTVNGLMKKVKVTVK